MPELKEPSVGFDWDSAIPIDESEGQLNRAPAFDFDWESARPEPKPIGKILKESAKEAAIETGEKVLQVLSVIRWPFWRFIEHPIGVIGEAIQDPEGKKVLPTLARAVQAYVPFRRIPKEEYGSYGTIWNNYYKATFNGNDAPDWYIAMASVGTAIGIEPGITRLAAKGVGKAVTRVATPSEAKIINKAFAPFKASLEKRGLDPSKLHPEGNIIKLTEESELFMNKYVSAVIKGDTIRVPRWAKIKQLPTVVTKPGVTPKAIVPTPPKILPTTGPEVVLTPPPIPKAPLKPESFIEKTKQYKNIEGFIKAKGLDPDSIDIKDSENFIVKNTAGKDALLVEIPIEQFGKPKFETLAEYEPKPERKITDPIEATLEEGKLIITDGANRFTQAVANGDKTIPVILEVAGKVAPEVKAEVIPKFKSTEEAEAFGKKATPGQIEGLKQEKIKLQEEFKTLEAAGKESEAFTLATGQKQFVNEALKVAPKEIIPKIPPELQPLAEEAKKFKSAKEFTESQISKDIDYQNIAKSVPDSDIPSEMSGFKKVGDKIVYTEGWCDRCFGNVIDEIGDDRSSLVEYAKKKTPEIAKQQPKLPQNKNLKGYELLDYKFIETPDNDVNYGVSIAVYGRKGTKQQLTDFYNQVTGKVAPEVKGKVVTEKDLGPPPEEPPKFPGVSEEFLKQPKPKTTILQYFTPAEYHLKQLGFDPKIGAPIREALKNFSVELMEKNEKLIAIQKKHFAQIPKNKKAIKASNEKLWEYMDKGIPKGQENTIEAKIAQELRPETEEMLKRINELNQKIGREEVKGIKNYILHMLKPEILNEIYAKGVIPPELAKVMEYIPPKNVFLRTAQQRKGIPDEWLVKNPYELMKAMYAIDLRYVHLQGALAKVDPYLKAVKDYYGEGLDYWSPETYKYLDDWVKQAIKMRPSNWDVLIDNMLEYTFAPLLRKAGLKVSHMPWRDLVNFLSAAVHTGALGMRIKPILRNLVQSTFDWVMYGTKPYLKAVGEFNKILPQKLSGILTGDKDKEKVMKLLNQFKVWKTRVPFEAQDLATLRTIFKAGSIGYRASDLHNVGKGLLTRYYYAIDNLGMTHKEAIKWADDDLPATQWSYRREDLPRAYWTTTGRAFWTLGSWWMNFYNRFLPELARRAFTGKDVLGRVVPTSERLGIVRFLVLMGLLFAVKEKSKELLGTTIDYTGQVKPTPLREAPIAGLGKALIKIAQGITDEDERSLKEGMSELSRTAKIFIPFYLAGQDLFDLVTGKKKLDEILFYQGRKKKEKIRFR